MEYYRINTNFKARSDVRTCDIWYKMNMAFAGDFSGLKNEHAKVFKKLCAGDGVFMHHSGLGIVGYGIVMNIWDKICYEADERMLYTNELYEYRINIDWLPEYDRRNRPIPITGRLPFMGTRNKIDPKKYNLQALLKDLHI